MVCVRTRAGSPSRARTAPFITPTQCLHLTRSSRGTSAACSSEHRKPNPTTPTPCGRTNTRTDSDRVVGRARRCRRRSSRVWKAFSAVEHRPADVVAQPLVVEYELANRVRELVALPPALESPCALALFRRGSTCGLDRICGRTELVCSDVCNGRGLTGSVSGVPCCSTQVSSRGVCMTGRRASLGHGDLTARPCAGLLDRLTRSRILRLSRLEEVEDVLRTRCRPQGQEQMIGIGEGPTAADRHETRVAVFREDHTHTPFACICRTSNTMPTWPRLTVGGLARPPSDALGGDGGLDHRLDRGARRRGRTSAILVHARRNSRAVVKQQESSSQLFGIGRAGFLGETSEQRPEPGPVLLGDDFACIARARLRRCHDEPAPAKRRPCQQLLNLGEDAEDPLPW